MRIVIDGREQRAKAIEILDDMKAIERFDSVSDLVPTSYSITFPVKITNAEGLVERLRWHLLDREDAIARWEGEGGR